MNIKNRTLITLFLLALLAGASYAQSPVSVNPLTGTAGINIPVYTLTSGQVAAPISLSYAATGIKVLDVENTAGMGWQLNCGGQVSRVVRGLPDDCIKDSVGHSRFGWISASNTAANWAGTFVPENNGTAPTCAEQGDDINFIDSKMNFNEDTEPDIFYINAPGLSCQMVYNRADTTFYPLVYQDLVIRHTIIGGSGYNAGEIGSFTITNDKGITYTFAAYNKVKQTTVNGAANAYFNTKFLQYQNSIFYSDTWYLTSMTDPYGNGITFTYTTAPERDSNDPVTLFFNGATTGSVQYDVQQAVTAKVLSTMGTINSVAAYPALLNFTWQSTKRPTYSGQTIISSISTSPTGLGHTFNFNYNQVVSQSSTTGFTRYFLASYTESGCSSPVNYQFSYIGQTGTAPNYNTTLPDSASVQIDYWGYMSSAATASTLIPTVYVLNPNGTSTYPRYVVGASTTPTGPYTYLTLGNNNRSATTSSVTAGTLNQITYAQGGSTTLVYEPNSYYDVPTLSAVQGGGIRVQQITDAPAPGAGNSIVRTYTYNNPATGVTSGEPITLPQFAFTTPNYNGTDTGRTTWKNATALSAYDLSTEDHTIMYAYVTVSQTGAGRTLNNYNISPTYWDNTFGTVDLVAQYTCPGTYGPIQNYANSYPFIPNPNYDERGLLVKSTSYNTTGPTGTEVSESNYTYTEPTTPAVIQAAKSDNMGSSAQKAKGYNIYPVNYNTSAFVATVNTVVFDSQSQKTSQSSTVNYTYGSPYHKLLTQQQTTNSDGSIITANYTYAKDFTATAGNVSNANIAAIYNLIQQNHNAPIETWRQYTPAGGSLTATDAALTFYRDTTISPGAGLCVIPSVQFKWTAPNGGTFNQLNISGNTITRSSDYVDVANYFIYDKTGFAQTVGDRHKHIQTTILDHFSGKPTAVFKNAAYNQIAFSDFDTDPTASPGTLSYRFTISGSGSYSPVGSHAGNAAGMASTQTATTGTLSKSSLAQNYIFSIWINPAAAGTLTLTVSGVAMLPSINYSGGWQYYELAIPAGGISSSFTVSFSTSQNITVDDILLYPDCAEAATVTYDAVNHYQLAATNTNGVSAYFTSDLWGRPLLQMDQDHNIVKKNTYITPASVATFNSPVISGSNPVNGQPISFTIAGPDACAAAGTTVTWHFGDGTSVTSPGLISPPHTYTALGPVTVTATINSPMFGTKTPPSLPVTVQPAYVPLSYNSYTVSNGAITEVIFTPIGSGTTYNFTTSQLNRVSVLQGNYTIQVFFLPGGQQYNPTTGAGYNSVALSSNCYNSCQNWASANNYTFTANLSSCTSLNFSVYQYLCAP